MSEGKARGSEAVQGSGRPAYLLVGRWTSGKVFSVQIEYPSSNVEGGHPTLSRRSEDSTVASSPGETATLGKKDTTFC